MKGKKNNNINILTERQKVVLETIRMRLTEKEALIYLSNAGFEMSDTTWYRQKNKLDELKIQRLYQIAKIGFEDQHLERIDKCELIEKLMWQNYLEEGSPYRRTVILEKIVNMQPYLSAYYEATEHVMKESDFMKRYYIPEFENDAAQSISSKKLVDGFNDDGDIS